MSFSYWSLLCYFAAIVVTAATVTLLLLLSLCCYWLPLLLLLSHYSANDTFLQILSLSGVVELTTQLLILENIIWLLLVEPGPMLKKAAPSCPPRWGAVHLECHVRLGCWVLL